MFGYSICLHYLCTMQKDYDSSASGYLADSFEGINQTFSDVKILHTSEVNIVAKAKRYGRWWLLKGLQKEVADKTGYQQMLRKELEILMMLQHPSIVTTIGLEDVDGLGACIVMEYVEGITLKEWLQDHPSAQARRRVMMELIEAVGYIHSKGIVHRDLKPGNILITTNGENVKLIDFGLADSDSYAVLKQPAGTIGYMAPEQAQAAKADVRNDIYSLGIIMQQMNLGYRYHRIANRCTASIEKRYQTIHELRQDYQSKKAGITIWLLGGIAIVAIGFIVAFAVWDSPAKMETPAPEPTEDIERASEEPISQKDSVENTQTRINDAIYAGCKAIDRKAKKTSMNEHLDTLSNIIYLRQDYGEVIQQTSLWVDQYVQTIGSEYTNEEIAQIRTAVSDHLGRVTLKWSTKIIQLKEVYDRQFEEGD